MLKNPNNNLSEIKLNKCFIKKDCLINIYKNIYNSNFIDNELIIDNNENNIHFNYLTINKFIQKNKINLIDKELLNNNKKIIKNNKNAYINKYFIKEKKKRKNPKNKRSSQYRGVSKNGLGWQVLMMYKNNKPYIGTYYSEELAARIYDIVSIKKNYINAKTNFLYNSEQIERILKVNIDFKSQNISNVVSELIK